MNGLLVALLLSTAPAAGPLRLTSGWPTVLDVVAAKAAHSADESVVVVAVLDSTQVLLVPVRPGHVQVSLEVGDGAAASTRLVDLTVQRGATFTAKADHVHVDVDDAPDLPLPGVRRVVSGDPSLCLGQLERPDELRLTPRRPGQAVLLVWVGGTDAAHRRALVVDVSAGQVRRSQDDLEAATTEPLDGRLALVAGEHARLALWPGTWRFASRDPEVVDARLDAHGELVVEGHQVGATFLHAWTAEGQRRRLYVVVNRHEVWDPHSIDWLLKLEAERRADDPVPVAPGEQAPGGPAVEAR